MPERRARSTTRRRRSFPLLWLGALLLWFGGALHPHFHNHHAAAGDEVPFFRPAAAADAGSTAVGPGNEFCPICAGLFQAAELPAGPDLPAVPAPAPEHRTLPARPQLTVIAPHAARAPPDC